MRKILFGFFMLLILAMGATLIVAQDQDVVETPASDSVSVTVYNQGTALVQDRRTFTLQPGINVVNFTDVAARIDPTSVSFKSLTDPLGTTVLEQNYVYDLVNSEALLNRYVDEIINVTMDDATTFTGQLLSGRGEEIILRTDAGEVVVLSLSKARDVRFPELPEGLITRPTLRWIINSSMEGPQQVELTYLTAGMNWTADYIVLLSRDKQSVDINGWVTLNNSSGTSFNDAQLKLVAGDVNRVPTNVQREYAADDQAFAAPMAETGGVAQREIFEYQLYEVERAVTISNNETKQVEFVTGAGIPAKTFYVYDSSPRSYGYYSFLSDQYYGQTGITDVQNWLEFTTDDDGGLGADLPAGRVRVYQKDIDDAALLIGENAIDHTPQGEDVQIFLGNAFDLVGERTQTDFNLITGQRLTETYEIRVRNRKDSETVEVRVPEQMFRWSNWTILSHSHEYTELNAGTIEFRVEVPPDGETVITYTVEYFWPK